MRNHVSLGAADAQVAILAIQAELVRRGKAAVIAWLVLSVQLHNDGFFQFKIVPDKITVTPKDSGALRPR